MKYASIVTATNEVLSQYSTRLTVRQIYYRLISPPFQLFENLAKNYKNFDRLLTKARENDDVDWERIEDRARTTIGGDKGYDGTEDYVDNMLYIDGDNYTRKMWEDQPEYIEVWVEKDALAALVSNAAEGFRVLTFPTRGYSSFTGVMQAIERFADLDENKRITVLHFTDHDPSGLNMKDDLARRLNEYGEGNVRIIRPALTFEQVQAMGLAPNPTKKADSRTPAYAAQYGDQCWELDAMLPDELQRIIKEAISTHIDAERWQRTLDRIERERKAITTVIETEKGAMQELKARMVQAINNRCKEGATP